MNFIATGDARSAGAQLKLLSSNPYLSDVDRARVFVENLVTFWVKVARGELTITPAFAAVLPAMAIVALVRREHRTIAGACLVCAIGWILLVSWNGNAPYHNFRYYAPALVLLAISAALGVATLASIGGRRTGAACGAIALLIIAPKVPGQVKHFRTSSANIRDQHIEVAERLAALPADAKILLNDAGVIPYVSGRPAVDAMGLGGYHRVPFAHAAVYGEAATIELIERLDPRDRPTHFALYPNWFGTLTSRFGVELDHVTITDNIICAGATKGIYRADWSTLDAPRARAASVVDEIDVGDVIDEAAHGYAPPLPHGGWTTLDVLTAPSGMRRFDGGRTIPDGMTESFVVARGASGAIVVRVRVDDGAHGIVVSTSRTTKELTIEPPRAGFWRHGMTTLDAIDGGETIQLRASGGEYRDYHVWIERSTAAEAR
jgi:hypothetical protein